MNVFSVIAVYQIGTKMRINDDYGGILKLGKVRMYGSHRVWTQDEVEKLRILCEEKTQSGIAKELGRSIQSVKSKRIELGIASFTDQTDKLSMKQIAELVGVDKSTIGKVWTKYGLRFRRV